MKKTITKYGALGFFTSLVLFHLSFLVGKGSSYKIQETLGYLTIVIALIFVFFAIKHYRDNQNHGNLTWKDGLAIGLSITFFVALGSAIADLVYVSIIYPDFATDYANYQLEKLKSSLPPAEFEIKRKELLQNVETIGKPLVMALVMFVTVMCLGTIITILSSLLLLNNKRVRS